MVPPVFQMCFDGKGGVRQHPIWLRERTDELLVEGVLSSAIPSVNEIAVANFKFYRDLRREFTIVVETLSVHMLAKSLQ